MPIYEYHCEACDHSFEHLSPTMSAASERIECPECGAPRASRQLSVPAAPRGGAAKGAAPTPLPRGGCGRCGDPNGSCGL